MDPEQMGVTKNEFRGGLKTRNERKGTKPGSAHCKLSGYQGKKGVAENGTSEESHVCVINDRGLTGVLGKMGTGFVLDQSAKSTFNNYC